MSRQYPTVHVICTSQQRILGQDSCQELAKNLPRTCQDLAKTLPRMPRLCRPSSRHDLAKNLPKILSKMIPRYDDKILAKGPFINYVIQIKAVLDPLPPPLSRNRHNNPLPPLLITSHLLPPPPPPFMNNHKSLRACIFGQFRAVMQAKLKETVFACGQLH